MNLLLLLYKCIVLHRGSQNFGVRLLVALDQKWHSCMTFASCTSCRPSAIVSACAINMPSKTWYSQASLSTKLAESQLLQGPEQGRAVVWMSCERSVSRRIFLFDEPCEAWLPACLIKFIIEASKPLSSCNTAYLCDALQGQLFHKVDDVGPGQKFFLELLHCHWEGCWIQHNLTACWKVTDDAFDRGLEFCGQQFVCLQWQTRQKSAWRERQQSWSVWRQKENETTWAAHFF